jgi:hypothetical protein
VLSYSQRQYHTRGLKNRVTRTNPPGALLAMSSSECSMQINVKEVPIFWAIVPMTWKCLFAGPPLDDSLASVRPFRGVRDDPQLSRDGWRRE